MRLMSVSNLPLTVDSAAGYDTWGNMRKYNLRSVAYELNFNNENRLASVKVGTSQPTVFAYDADGQRVMTTQPDGTIIYTPFPDYELTDPPTGADTVRTTYRLGGQIVAVQTKVGAAAGVFYFTYTDHLGNISAMSTTARVYVANSTARYDPFGTMTTAPATNPAISNHGFTGHRHNNTATNNLGLIYMNARYYLPEIGRFISPDTIVPDPTNPQSYNRYSYVLNLPMNYTDPTGHAESSGCEYEGCMSDPDTWGENFVAYLENTTDFNDPTDNPQGQIFLSFYYQTLPLGLEDGASVNEIVSQTIQDTSSYMRQARAGWYPTTSDADLLVKTLLLASVDVGSDNGIDGERGSVIPRNRSITHYYPNNNGFNGPSQRITLESGTIVDRYGSTYGSFASPHGTPPWARSLPHGWENQPYHAFEVIKSLDVDVGNVAPWFGQPGGGKQFLFDAPIQDLLDNGFLRMIK